jgi:hypothetical protein
LPTDQGSAESIQCAVCGPWPEADRAWVREWVTVSPLRVEVCEDCLRAVSRWPPWGPPNER